MPTIQPRETDVAYQLRLKAYANHIPGRQHDIAGVHYDVTTCGAWKRTTAKKSRKAAHRLEVQTALENKEAVRQAKNALTPKGIAKVAKAAELKAKRIRKDAVIAKRLQFATQNPKSPESWLHASARAMALVKRAQQA
jgi:hypothetical protein